jgi:hypothetical protein
VRVVSIPALAILRRASTSRKLLTLTNALFRIQFLFILMNDIDVIYAMLWNVDLRTLSLHRASNLDGCDAKAAVR